MFTDFISKIKSILRGKAFRSSITVLFSFYTFFVPFHLASALHNSGSESPSPLEPNHSHPLILHDSAEGDTSNQHSPLCIADHVVNGTLQKQASPSSLQFDFIPATLAPIVSVKMDVALPPAYFSAPLMKPQPDSQRTRGPPAI